MHAILISRRKISPPSFQQLTRRQHSRIVIVFLVSAIALLAVLSPPATAALPPEIRALMKKHKISPNRAAIVVHRIGDKLPLVSHRADKIHNPASITKLPLSFAAIDILGAVHEWQTTFSYDGKLKNGVLDGDLIITGSGDPYITTDRFLFFVNDLRSRGIHTIKGDLIIDDSRFALQPHVDKAFDGATNKPYNVGGGALAVNFKAQRVIISPRPDNTLHAYTDPPNDNFIIKNQLKNGKGRCSSWRRGIRELYRGDEYSMTLTLARRFPARCGEQSFHIAAPISHAANVAGIFSALWRRLGGVWEGQWGISSAPPKAKKIATFKSPPLIDIIRSMNKYSNNVIARNLFISLDDSKTAQTVEGGRNVFSQWMRLQGVEGDFFVENGSGLSRDGRVSAGQLAQLMNNLWQHPLRAEIISSLPVLGIDGTLRKRLRKNDKGQGHLKTGSLDGVKNIAGFIRDKEGRDLIFICLIERQSGGRAKNFQDALIARMRRGGV
ncbi:MAG: D-alanyl-D-alanine carboxypeptidase/D-alanyl-D-alanine-endopeptidase [Gammaproteobacteria bacterium WSBS_2016_MAG_OTU1]